MMVLGDGIVRIHWNGITPIAAKMLQLLSRSVRVTPEVHTKIDFNELRTRSLEEQKAAILQVAQGGNEFAADTMAVILYGHKLGQATGFVRKLLQGESSPVVSPKRMSNLARMMWIILLAAIPAYLFNMAVQSVLTQHQKICSFKPVQATITSSTVREARPSSGRSTPSLRPAIIYRYEVGGRMFESKQLTPVTVTGKGSWAADTVNCYPAGAITQAYYDPVNPADAFLVRHYSFMPYLFALTTMILLLPLAAVFFNDRELSGPPIRANQRRVVIYAATLWNCVGLVVCGHYFFAASPDYEWLGVIGSAVYAAIGCFLIGRTFLLGTRMRRQNSASG